MAGGKSKARVHHGGTYTKKQHEPSVTATISKQRQVDVDIHVAQMCTIVDNTSTETFRITCNDVATLAILALMLMMALTMAGVAAGMSISIHYYEGPAIQQTREKVPVHAQRVTVLDHEMVAHNVMSVPNGLDIGRVVATAKVSSIKNHGYDAAVNSNSYLGDVIYTESTIRPGICPDGTTRGFQDWVTLKAAIREANALSAEKFMRWNEYFAAMEGHDEGAFRVDSLYYEEDVIITICPRATLKARKGPIFINVENLALECDDCIIDVGGTHFAFGPHAKNILVRGITFTGAQSSSLTFHFDGAEASFEDCLWHGNIGSNKFGAVADINSTSSVTFSRCEISDMREYVSRPKGRQVGRHSAVASNSGFAASLTIRE